MEVTEAQSHGTMLAKGFVINCFRVKARKSTGLPKAEEDDMLKFQAFRKRSV